MINRAHAQSNTNSGLLLLVIFFLGLNLINPILISLEVLLLIGFTKYCTVILGFTGVKGEEPPIGYTVNKTLYCCYYYRRLYCKCLIVHKIQLRANWPRQ